VKFSRLAAANNSGFWHRQTNQLTFVGIS